MELIGYDLDVLRDWYKIVQLLKPQEKARERLKTWLFNLFEGNDSIYKWDSDDYDSFDTFRSLSFYDTNTSSTGAGTSTSSTLFNLKSPNMVTTPDRYYQYRSVLPDYQVNPMDSARDNDNIKFPRKVSEPINSSNKNLKSDTFDCDGSSPRSSPRTPKSLRHTATANTSVRSMLLGPPHMSQSTSWSKDSSKDSSQSHLFNLLPIDRSAERLSNNTFRESHSSSNNNVVSSTSGSTLGMVNSSPSNLNRPVELLSHSSLNALNFPQTSISLDESFKSVSGGAGGGVGSSSNSSSRDTTNASLSERQVLQSSVSDIIKDKSNMRRHSGSSTPTISGYLKSFYKTKPPANERGVSDASVKTGGSSSSNLLSRIFSFKISRNSKSLLNSTKDGHSNNSGPSSDGRPSTEEYFNYHFEGNDYENHMSRDSEDQIIHTHKPEIQTNKTTIEIDTTNFSHIATGTNTISETNSTGGGGGLFSALMSPVLKPNNTANHPTVAVEANPPSVGVLDMLLDSPIVKYTGIDVPPSGVLQMLNIYYPSKLCQQFCMDLISLQPGRVFMSTNDLTKDTSIDFSHTPTDQLLLTLPTPYPIYGIYFSPSKYAFKRIARVIEKLIEERNSEEIHYNDFASGKYRRWSLAFRDDSFSPEVMTDFYQNVTQFLAKCPQIVSLSFTASHLVATSKSPHSSNKQPEQNAHMGHVSNKFYYILSYDFYSILLSTKIMNEFYKIYFYLLYLYLNI